MAQQWGFQSAPLTEARGDSMKRWWNTDPAGVSIRSPHRSKGRPNSLSPNDCTSSFQSAPLTEARGDSWAFLRCLADTCFNPLPLPKQGETSLPRLRRIRLKCFNPLPLPKQGETVQRFPLCEWGWVSIRSPYRSKGRPLSGACSTAWPWFQSAPLTEARGDQYRLASHW